MSGKFVPASDAPREEFDWGRFNWISRPGDTGAEQLVVTSVDILPGQGHNFHLHPDQEEVIYVIEGTCEQWLEEEKRLLGPGDAIFIPKNTVHASFNATDGNLKALAILSPAVGADGYELVDVSGEAPWNTLRA